MAVKLLRSHINGYYVNDDPYQRLSVNDQEARLISDMVNKRFVLEIGTGLGVSTRALAEKATNVVTIDPDPWVTENIQPLLKDLKNVIFLEEIPTSGKFDAVFVDGNHDYENVKDDIEKAKKVCISGAVFIFHDSKYVGVRKAIEESFGNFVDCRTAAGIGIAFL